MLGPEVTQFLEVVVDVLHRSEPVFGGVGFAIALGLILALGAVLPCGRRRKVKGSVWLLFLHVAAAAPMAFIDSAAVESKLSLVAAFFLLASLGRSAFLLLVDSFLARRAMQPVPQILRDVLQAALYVVIGLLVLRAAGVEPGSLLTTSALLTAVIPFGVDRVVGGRSDGHWRVRRRNGVHPLPEVLVASGSVRETLERLSDLARVAKKLAKGVAKPPFATPGATATATTRQSIGFWMSCPRLPFGTGSARSRGGCARRSATTECCAEKQPRRSPRSSAAR
jgi:hypothetical protein